MIGRITGDAADRFREKPRSGLSPVARRWREEQRWPCGSDGVAPRAAPSRGIKKGRGSHELPGTPRFVSDFGISYVSP